MIAVTGSSSLWRGRQHAPGWLLQLEEWRVSSHGACGAASSCMTAFERHIDTSPGQLVIRAGQVMNVKAGWRWGRRKWISITTSTAKVKEGGWHNRSTELCVALLWYPEDVDIDVSPSSSSDLPVRYFRCDERRWWHMRVVVLMVVHQLALSPDNMAHSWEYVRCCLPVVVLMDWWLIEGICCLHPW